VSVGVRGISADDTGRRGIVAATTARRRAAADAMTPAVVGGRRDGLWSAAPSLRRVGPV
jgi:hypothetical protein